MLNQTHNVSAPAQISPEDLEQISGGAMPSEFFNLTNHQRMLLWFASDGGVVNVLIDGRPGTIRI